MKTVGGFLAAMASWGLFIFQIPSLAAETKQWASIFREIHLYAISLAEELATHLPPAPAQLAEQGFWGSFATIMTFWPHVVFLISLLLLGAFLGLLLGFVSWKSFKNERSVEIISGALVIIWLLYSLVGPKMVLHSAYPELGQVNFIEPIQQTVGRTQEPTIALYLTYVYSMFGILSANFGLMLIAIGWRRHQKKQRSDG